MGELQSYQLNDSANENTVRRIEKKKWKRAKKETALHNQIPRQCTRMRSAPLVAPGGWNLAANTRSLRKMQFALLLHGPTDSARS